MLFKRLLNFNQKSDLKIAIVGGSNSVIRSGYAKYLEIYLGKRLSQTTSLNYYSLGGVTNIHGAIQQERWDIARENDLIFFEYCVNDRYAIEENLYSLELAGRALEGFIQKIKKSNPNCLIVFLIFGINLDSYYDNHCSLSELYESIGKQYQLPVINLTELLIKEGGVIYVKSLYNQKDWAHYTRPEGVQIVAQKILDSLDKWGIIQQLKSSKKPFFIVDRQPIYPNNFKNLKYYDRWEEGDFFQSSPKIGIYQNTVYREKNFTIYPGNSLNFYLKGCLVAIYIKSDLNDGFIKIKFGDREIITSSYSSWLNRIKPQNVINLITLPLIKFQPSTDFQEVSLSLCEEYPQTYDLCLDKTVPLKADPKKWKLSIIGIAYTGEIKNRAQ